MGVSLRETPCDHPAEYARGVMGTRFYGSSTWEFRSAELLVRSAARSSSGLGSGELASEGLVTPGCPSDSLRVSSAWSDGSSWWIIALRA
jgi:hypothetical protein